MQLKGLEACISDIRKWMCENMLKLNDAKTYVILICSPYNLREVKKVDVKVGSAVVTSSSSI